MQRIRIIPGYLKSAALRRALWSEGADNYMASWPDGMSNLANVRLTLLRAGQEVEDGAVVPNVVGASWKFESSDIANDPLNSVSKFFQPLLSHLDWGLRDIEDGDGLIAPSKQVIDERGFTAANIDDGG